MELIDKRVIALLQTFLKKDLENVQTDMRLPELDSIVFIELVVTTEAEFDIELYDEELLYNPRITIQDWIDIVKKHLSDEEDSKSTENPLLR